MNKQLSYKELEVDILNRDLNIPNVIYKYVDINTAIKILSNTSLIFQSPYEFNDPFDCHSDLINAKFSKRALRRSFNEEANRRNYDFKDVNRVTKGYFKFPTYSEYCSSVNSSIQNLLIKMGISCFSCNYNNILMWSHYADDHKGLCIGFLSSEIKKISQSLSFVKYTKDFKPIDFFLYEELAVHHWLHTKSVDWQYEEEIRSITKQKGIYKITNESFIQIYFGCRTPDEHITSLIKLSKEKYRVGIYQMKIKKNSFELIPENI